MSTADQHMQICTSSKDANLHVSPDNTENSANLQSKRLATHKAQLALKGFAVHDVSTGGYFVAGRNLTKFCPALADLQAFAEQVGAA